MTPSETDLAKTLIIALLGAGGATFVWTMVRSIIAWKDSAEGREDKAIARLERFESSCREQLECERQMGSYWYRCFGILQHTLERNGIPMPRLPKRPATFVSYAGEPEDPEEGDA